MPASRKRVAIACQGGGSHTAFTAGVLARLFDEGLDGYDVVGLSGTSGGAVCALLAWSAMISGEPASAGRRLEGFWADNSATAPWERLLNASAMWFGELQQFLVAPSLSPYDNVFAVSAADEFKRLLTRHVDFARLAAQRDRRRPVLLLGAVDVLSGRFRVFDSRHDAIGPDAVLASAAIPTLFRAVPVDGGVYWDGLFSQNPPIRELIDVEPDEIWVIQINPTERDAEPKSVLDIADRRNELAGNLSLYQELHFVEKIDELLEAGVLAPDCGYKSIVVRIIELSPSRVHQSLSVRSKLNRDPGFIQALIAHGRTQAGELLTALAFELAWQRGDAKGLSALLADDVELVSRAPFPDSGRARGNERVTEFLARHMSGLAIDATRKQVARESVEWTVKLRSDGAPNGGRSARGRGPRAQRGTAEIALRGGKVDRLTLGPYQAV